MIIKYRVHEVAKDFGKQSKAVVDITPKKAGSAAKNSPAGATAEGDRREEKYL